MKAEPGRMIPRKPTENLELLFVDLLTWFLQQLIFFEASCRTVLTKYA